MPNHDVNDEHSAPVSAADETTAAPPAPVYPQPTADLDTFEIQGIHDIVDEEQGKITLADQHPLPRRNAKGEQTDLSADTLSRLPPAKTTAPVPTQPENLLTPPPPPKHGVTDSGVEFAEVSLGTPKQFDQMFRPSDTYAGSHSMDDETMDEKPKAPPGPSLLTRWRRALPEEPKLTLEQALARSKWFARSLHIRFLISLLFLIPSILLSVFQNSELLPRALRYASEPYMVILLLLIFHFLVILLGIDLLAKGFLDLLRLRPGGESLLLFAAFVTLLHSLSIVAPFPFFADSVGFLPYSTVSTAAISFSIWGESQRRKALGRTYKTVLSGGEAPDVVVCEDEVLDGKPGFSRHPQGVPDFHLITERPDASIRVMSFLTPLLMIFCVFLALISSGNHKEGNFFLWSLAAITNAAFPLTTFWVFSGFFARLSARLAHMGAALTGWTAAMEMSRGSSAILTDGDLFPPGSVAPNGKRINNNASSEIMSYAASILEASGSGLFRVFREMLAEENGNLCAVTNLKPEEGGLSAVIESNTVLLGTYNFLLQAGVDIPKEGRIKNGVFIAINRQLAGIFVILYIPSLQVEGALTLMENQKLNIMLATRDFNVTPSLLKEKYHVNPDPVDYPHAEERTRLSDPGRVRSGSPVAVLTRDGLCPYIEAVVGGQRLHRITLINLVLQLLSLFSTLFIVYYFTRIVPSAEAAMSIAPGNLVLYMLVWWAAGWVVSWFGSRY